jgi:hypothetical protein
MKSFRTLFLIAFLVPLAATAGCTIQIDERSLIRPVPSGPLTAEALARAAPGLRLEPHTITASDGTALAAVLLRSPGADLTILYFGGNQFTVGRFGAGTAHLMAPLKVNLMLVDYRGYGVSAGAPTAARLMTDGLDVYDHLARLPGVGRIVVHGQSLGSFVAGNVAAERTTAGVVLESTVTTTEDWVRSQAGGMRVAVAPALAGLGNRRNIARIEEPLLILVGARDTTTPPALSEALYRQSPLPPGRKMLSIIPGAGHDGVLVQPAAREAYRAFLGSLRSS